MTYEELFEVVRVLAPEGSAVSVSRDRWRSNGSSLPEEWSIYVASPAEFFRGATPEEALDRFTEKYGMKEAG